MAFVCFANNYLQYIKSRRLAAEPDELRKYLQRIQHCQKPVESWALSAGGSVVAQDLAHSIYEVPASALSDVAKLQERFADETTLDCWVGVGRDMHEAVMAAEVAERKNLSRPLFSHEEYEEKEETKPSLNIAKSEPEELEKNVKNWIKGVGAAALLAGGGMMAAKYGMKQKPVEAPVASAVKPVAPLARPDLSKPQMRDEPKIVNNPIHDETFWAHYEPKTLYHGTHDALWTIGMGETTGGLQWDHKKDTDTVFHPINGERLVDKENTAFGHFGMKPYTALGAYINGVGGVKKFKRIMEPEIHASGVVPTNKEFSRDDYENAFMNKFKKDPNFYNQVAKMTFNQILKKHKREGRAGIINPFYVLNAWHYGNNADDVKRKDKSGKVVRHNEIAEDKGNYTGLLLGHLAREVRKGRNLNFRNTFGNEGHNIIMQAVKDHIEKEDAIKASKGKK